MAFQVVASAPASKRAFRNVKNPVYDRLAEAFAATPIGQWLVVPYEDLPDLSAKSLRRLQRDSSAASGRISAALKARGYDRTHMRFRNVVDERRCYVQRVA